MELLTTSFFARRLQQYILAAGWFLIDRDFPITSMESPRMSRWIRDIFPLRSSPLLAEMELTVIVMAFCRSNRYFFRAGSPVVVIPSVAAAALESFSCRSLYTVSIDFGIPTAWEQVHVHVGIGTCTRGNPLNVWTTGIFLL